MVLFIWGYFREWKMSVAALVALFHDIALTIGVYSLSGFPVTPAAVTGLLAILGFSMYDTVVVFDKIRENTHELRSAARPTRQAANLAVNQTLVRSINTSIVALIPIGAILYVSAVQLGASSLKDLALAQFVGMAAGVFSSVFIAPRVLVHMKSTESEVKPADKRAKARAARSRPLRDGAGLHRGPAGAAPSRGSRRGRGRPRGRRPGLPSGRRPRPRHERRRRPAAVGSPPRPVVRSAEPLGGWRVQPTRQPKSKRDKK